MELTRPQRFQNHLVLGAALAGTAGALLVVLGAVPLPDLSGTLEDATNTLGSWAYPAVAGFAFLETGAFVGLAVPGETAVVVGGVVAARGEVELVPLIGLVWLAAAAGRPREFPAGPAPRAPLPRFVMAAGLRLGPERLEKRGALLRPPRRQSCARWPLRWACARGVALPRRGLGPHAAPLRALERGGCAALGGNLHARRATGSLSRLPSRARTRRAHRARRGAGRSVWPMPLSRRFAQAA